MDSKRIVLLVVVLLGVSAVGTLVSYTLPTEAEQETALVNYSHNGRFDYVAYLKPSFLFGPEPEQSLSTPPATPELSSLKYPVNMVDRFNFSFSYRFVPGQPVQNVAEKVSVIATSRGKDAKPVEVTLVPETEQVGDFTLIFPLSPAESFSEDISGNEITVTISVFSTVETEDGPLFESFTQTLRIKSDGTVYIMDRTFNQTEDGYSGQLVYEQNGQIEYTVLLKADSLFGAVELTVPEVVPPEPPPQPLANTIGPEDTLFIKLLEKADATFHYRFVADKPVTNLREVVSITALLESEKFWKKEIILVPPAEKSGDFSVGFPLDLAGLGKMFETIRAETGASADSSKLTISATVRVTAQTGSGPINEVYTQSLSTTLTGSIVKWNEKLAQTKQASLTTTTTLPNHFLGLPVPGARVLFLILTGVFFLLSAFSVFRYMKLRPALKPSAVEKELSQIKKKYGQRMAEATGQTFEREENTVSVCSMEDLIKISDELGKPVIYQPSALSKSRHSFFIFDSSTRYQYVLTESFETPGDK